MNVRTGPCQSAGTGADEAQCFFLDRVKLQAAQRLWIQFRDANCEAEYDLYSGGSAGPIVREACLAATTRQRTAELHVMYDWQLKK
jgi:uncharacterized protein YecT (DUF1311 family)